MLLANFLAPRHTSGRSPLASSSGGRTVSLKPEPIGPVPEETARVTHAAFPKGFSYTRMRDELGISKTTVNDILKRSRSDAPVVVQGGSQ